MDYQSKKTDAVEPKVAERAPVEKVVNSEITQKKPGLARRFKNTFFGGDAKSAAANVAAEVLLPAVRNLLVDAGTEGIRRVVYGDNPPARDRGYGGANRRTPRTTYSHPVRRNRYDRNDYAQLPDQPPRLKPTVSPTDDVEFPELADAERVLEHMYMILEQYERVSAADFLDLCGLPTTHTDNKWGWRHLPASAVQQTRSGWVLNLPPAEPI